MHRPHTSFLAAATGLLLFVGAVDQDTSSIADTPDFNAPGRSDHELRSFASPLKCLLCSDFKRGGSHVVSAQGPAKGANLVK